MQGLCVWALHQLPNTPFQNKVEDRLDEAIHVLRSHAVGTAADGHGLLPGHGALASGFPGPVLPLGGRHASLVSAVRGRAEGDGGGGARWAGRLTSGLPCLQVGGGHSEDTPTGGGNLTHSHVALPSQPGPLPDLSRPPDSYSGKPPRPGWDGGRGGRRLGVSCALTSCARPGQRAVCP